ncbi:MAG: segregation and condensation protein A [Candidatus Promineifilaceae bacterium]|jgi:segregation and condensation protein A
MTTSTIQDISLPSFSGPLDLLLHLIEKNEMDITAISLARVAEQFLQEIDKLKQQHERIEPLMEFLVVGAQLVLIKSRALLPDTKIKIEGEDEEDPAEALARRLLEYKQFKAASKWLLERTESNSRTYLRIAPVPKRPAPAKPDLSGVTTNTLYQFLIDILLRAEELKDSTSVRQRQKYTIEGQIDRLRAMVRSKGSFTFRDLLSSSANRSEFSVTLLAALECIKRQEVVASQDYMFGPVTIKRASEQIDTDDIQPNLV